VTPNDREAEQAILGTVAMVGEKILPLLHQAGLRADHFYAYENVWSDVLAAADQGVPVDTVTVPALAPYAGSVPAIGNVEAYARRVIEKARWRNLQTAGYLLQEAALDEDDRRVAEAERLLIAPQESNRVFTRERLQGLMMDRLDGQALPGWEMPFFRQRLMPGTVWLWGGWTSHGKTVWVDQIARSLHEQGARVWAWLNEMSAEERLCRHASATTGIDLERVQENRLTDAEKARVVTAMKTIPFEIVECPGWSGEEIARDLRVRHADVSIIDILHRVPYENERDLSRISRVLGDAAKLANTVILATVHLNRGRIIAPARPQPTLADIKGASAFEQDADGVGMVWRQDDDVTGRPTNIGQIYSLKVRQGKPSGVSVVFDGERARFEAA
jgi:replicative DNA helicase